MADESQDNQDPPEITLESVDAFDADNLTEDQTKFLEENKADLTPEQQEKFGIKAEEKDEEPNPDEVEPETRTAKKEEKSKEGEVETPDKDKDEDEIDPDDEKTIGKVVSKKLAPVTEALKQLEELRDQNEVDAFIRQNPDYEKYRAVALKYMGHPSYKNIPAKNIMAIVAAGGLQKIGAQKEREAARKAKETQGNGGQVRTPAGGKTDWKNMTKEDFEAEKARVLQGAR